jgi:hypothetical protein
VVAGGPIAGGPGVLAPAAAEVAGSMTTTHAVVEGEKGECSQSNVRPVVTLEDLRHVVAPMVPLLLFLLPPTPSSPQRDFLLPSPKPNFR